MAELADAWEAHMRIPPERRNLELGFRVLERERV